MCAILNSNFPNSNLVAFLGAENLAAIHAMENEEEPEEHEGKAVIGTSNEVPVEAMITGTDSCGNSDDEDDEDDNVEERYSNRNGGGGGGGGGENA